MAPATVIIAGMNLFSAENIVVDLPGKDAAKRIVDGVSLELEAGKIYDLNGASGCGKSTTLLACAKLVPISSGSLSLEGRASDAYTPEQWRKRVCLVPQKAQMVDGTVKDNLLLPWRMNARKAETTPDADVLKEALLEAMLADVELDRDASQLSGGQIARIALLRAFLAKPDVLLLDEVDSALDEESAIAISELTKKQAQSGATILRVRHRASDGLASKTFQMANGRMAR